jgi:hypothetical protein
MFCARVRCMSSGNESVVRHRSVGCETGPVMTVGSGGNLSLAGRNLESKAKMIDGGEAVRLWARMGRSLLRR